ncbi:MAG: beta-galactosidase trimerization domain-containing protein, partial [Anaerolineae bacterium]|nr:beta-galactosidase trimerization domain-containing protein [Anaerolineae bacterium]
NIDEVKVLYLSHAIQLHQEEADRLKAWVAAGGVLIAEGCPGYFNGNGRANTRQPGLGLDELFGARERNVEFMPDLGHEISFTMDGCAVRGGFYRQVYRVTTGKVRGTYAGGECAVVENTYGMGRTLLIGTFPSVGYFESRGAANAAYFRNVLLWSGVEPHVTVSNPAVTARLQASAENIYLWALNTSAQKQQVSIRISPSQGMFTSVRAHWGSFDGQLTNNTLQVEIPAQDAIVLRFNH